MGIFSRKGSKLSTTNSSDSHISPTGSTPKSAVFPNHEGISSLSSTIISVPDISLPKPPDPALDPAAYLQSIHAVRERSRRIYEKARRNQLNYFTVDMSRFTQLGKYVVSIIKRDYESEYSAIPAYGHWQNFGAGGRPRVDQLLASWPKAVEKQERTKRLIDLFFVSVLLDADAGIGWRYKSKESGKIYSRSEGLAIASLEMFKAGKFSSDPDMPHQVDSNGLRKIDIRVLGKGLQVTESNFISGLQGRAELIRGLAEVLQNQKVFGIEARPGNILDYLLSHPSTSAQSVPLIPLPILWTVLMDSLSPIWPSTSTHIDGVCIGDAWPCSLMPSHPTHPWESIVPFHKVVQWLTYSLMDPMKKLLNVYFVGTELLTGPPDYSNSGLLVDIGVLTLKPEENERGLAQYRKNAQLKGQPNMEVVPLFSIDDGVIVEWRAITMCFLDELLAEVNGLLGLSGNNALTLPQMLEAGTWKGGRELAEVSRPNTKEPPIMVLSDGVFL